MSLITSQILGKSSLREDDSVPLPAGAHLSRSARRRPRLRAVNRRAIAAIMGLSEEEESIFPEEVEEIDAAGMAPGINVPDEVMDKDRAPKDPAEPVYGNENGEELMSPAVALVAPDVTPQALEPLDPSQVPPAPRQAQGQDQASGDDALRTILGKDRPQPDMEANPVTAESVQASVNASLGIVGGGGGLNEGVPLPDHVPGNGRRILEAFSRFVR